MPSLNHLEVHVTDEHGKPLEEYGTHKIAKSDLVSCFIESENDKPFHITIKVLKTPFPFPEPAASEHHPQLLHNSCLPGLNMIDNMVPFHLLASIRVDGRERPQKQVIVYLDANHPDFRETHTVRERIVYNARGEMVFAYWAFSELGIDDVFSQLLGSLALGDDADAVPLTADEEFAQAFTKLGERGLQDRPEGQGAGQIEIALERVTIRTIRNVRRGTWRPSREPATVEDAPSDDINGPASDLRDITHTVGSTYGDPRVISRVDAIEYDLWPDPAERRFATFRFYYRSAEKLAKYGFAGFATGAAEPGCATVRGVVAKRKLVGGGVEGVRKRDEKGDSEGEGEGEGEMPVKAKVKVGRWEGRMAVGRSRAE